MVEVSNKQWQEIQDLFKKKNNEIIALNEQLSEQKADAVNLANELEITYRLNDVVVKENTELKSEITKLTFDIKKVDCQLSLMLNNLHEAHNLLETYGLANRKSRLNSIDIKNLDITV